MSRTEFLKELAKVLNKHNIDTATDTPDYILAEYLNSCLRSYLIVNYNNRNWHGEENKGLLK